MLKRTFGVAVMVLATVFGGSALSLDNAIDNGAKKVAGGVKAMGKSAEEIGKKAGNAVEGAARDTGSALGKAWDDIVRGVEKAFR